MKRQKKDELVGKAIIEVLILSGIALIFWFSYKAFDYIPTVGIAPYILVISSIVLIALGIYSWSLVKRKNDEFYKRYMAYGAIFGIIGLFTTYSIVFGSFIKITMFQMFYLIWAIILLTAIGTIINTAYKVTRK